MSKLILLLLLVLPLSLTKEQLRLRYGNTFATLNRTSAGFNGILRLNSIGGSGGYTYFVTNLPSGWGIDGGVLTIPNIMNINGNYNVRVRVSDSEGSVWQENVRITIRGVNIFLQSENGGNFNNQYTQSSSSSSSSSLSSSSSSGTVDIGSILNSLSSQTNSISENQNSVISGSTITTFVNSENNNNGASGSAPFPGNFNIPGDVNRDSSLVSLYQSYPGLPSGTTPNQIVNQIVSSRYTASTSAQGQETIRPQANTPLLPSIVPSVINTARASYNASRDSNTITIDEVKRNAAFNRQQFANRAVANLIAIIQQLTANINAAKNDISTLQVQQKDAERSNTQCSNRVYDLSNTRTKIQNAIKDRQDRIFDTNQKLENLAPSIKELNAGRDNLIRKRTEIESARSPNSVKLSDLQKQLKVSTMSRQKVQRQLDSLNSNVDGLSNDIKKTRQDAASAPRSIQLIDQQIPIVQGRIDDLQKQLKNAQREKAKLLQDKDNYQRSMLNANKKIDELQRSIKDYRDKIPEIQGQISDANGEIDLIQRQIDEFRGQIAQKQADYKILNQQISTQEGLIANKNNQVKKLGDSISSLPSQIISLQQQFSRIQQIIKRQYYVCNQAADIVRSVKQNIQALNAKYNTQSNWLREANNNLEKARAEKQLADQGIQQIIASSTNALPFSIIPNGNGQTITGSPPGNNPSGSPLGPVPQRNQVIPGSPVVVGDLRTYLSQAYGASVDPTKPSTVTTLFPLSSLTTQALSGQSTSGIFNPDGSSLIGNNLNRGRGYQNFSCRNNNNGGGYVQGRGRVISLQPGQLIVSSQNGNPVTLKVASCSKLNGIQRDPTIVPKTPIYWRGMHRSPGVVNLQQLTCVDNLW